MNRNDDAFGSKSILNDNVGNKENKKHKKVHDLKSNDIENFDSCVCYNNIYDFSNENKVVEICSQKQDCKLDSRMDSQNVTFGHYSYENEKSGSKLDISNVRKSTYVHRAYFTLRTILTSYVSNLLNVKCSVVEHFEILTKGVKNAVDCTSHNLSLRICTILTAVILTAVILTAVILTVSVTRECQVSIVLTFLTLTCVFSDNLTVLVALMLTVSLTDTVGSTEFRVAVISTPFKVTGVVLDLVILLSVLIFVVTLTILVIVEVLVLSIIVASLTFDVTTCIFFRALNVDVRMTGVYMTTSKLSNENDWILTVKVTVLSICVFLEINGRAYICVCVSICARDSYVFYPLFAVSDFFMWRPQLKVMDCNFKFVYFIIFIINGKLSTRQPSRSITMASVVCVHYKRLYELVCDLDSVADVIKKRAYHDGTDFSLVLSVDIRKPVIFYCYYNFIIDNVIPNIVLSFLHMSVILMPFFKIAYFYPVSGFLVSLSCQFAENVGVVESTSSNML